MYRVLAHRARQSLLCFVTEISRNEMKFSRMGIATSESFIQAERPPWFKKDTVKIK